jgi:hypothetical protein
VIDYNINDKHHLFGRYSLADFILEGPELGAIAAARRHSASRAIVTRGTRVWRWATPTASTRRCSPISGSVTIATVRNNLPNGFGQNPPWMPAFQLNTGTPDSSGMPAFYVNGTAGSCSVTHSALMAVTARLVKLKIISSG